MSPTENMSVTMAIAPTSRGLGYIAFEHPGLALDWGVKDARKRKQRDCLAKASQLMRALGPTLLILEDVEHPNSRRSKRIKLLIEKIAELGKQHGIAVATCSRHALQAVFGKMGAVSKDEIAEAVVRLVPELEPKLPRRRRMWESEHYNMGIFEAAALVLTHFARRESESRVATEVE